jgi:hypothetical protein
VDRQLQLESLIDSLQQLIALLQQDSSCPWTNGFRQFLTDAQSLSGQSYSQQELHNLAAPIMHLFGGMGSFSDYVPYFDGKVAPWIEQFVRVSRKVYNDALSLRVVPS